MEYFIIAVEVLILFFSLVALYFLFVTRGSLIIQSLFDAENSRSHIYWVYSNKYLIWLTDRQFVVSAILLFNYKRLVDGVVRSLNPSLEGKRVLQVSCAFGNITNRIVKKCINEGAEQVVITDLMPNELRHTENKLKKARLDDICSFALEDAVELSHPEESFDYVVLFFLFHELPYPKKVEVLKECSRVLRPGGKIIFGEFHCPTSKLLKISGKCFFWIFEKFAYEMWYRFDPEEVLDRETDERWEYFRKTYLFGNYQLFTAKKLDS